MYVHYLYSPISADGNCTSRWGLHFTTSYTLLIKHASLFALNISRFTPTSYNARIVYNRTIVNADHERRCSDVRHARTEVIPV